MEYSSFVDFHAHILPGADHGSDSVETSVIQLSMASEVGVFSILATPHFYPNLHTVQDFLFRRNKAYQTLKPVADAKNIRIALSAEILLCEGIESLANIELLAVSGTNVLLIELPFSLITEGMVESVEALIKKGFCVVIAHADRYKFSDVEKFISIGAKIQLNAESVSGVFIKPRAKKCLSTGAVVALGSDIHGRNKKHYKRFAKATSRLADYGIMQKCKDILKEAQFRAVL